MLVYITHVTNYYFQTSGQIHEKVVSKCKNPITPFPLSKNAVATIFHISKLLPLILLKSIGYLLRSYFLFFPFPLLSCYISISFSAIKGIQISLFSLLFLCCFIKSLFCYCGPILHITHSICSLYRWLQILTIFRRHLHYFVLLNCLGRHFPHDASSPTFPFYNSYSLHILVLQLAIF